MEEARKEIERFFPNGDDKSKPVGYVWARTIPCQNPRCKAEIPLFRDYWLARKEKKRIALCPTVSKKKISNISFRIVGDDYPMPDSFDPYKGSVARGVVTCPACGTSIDASSVKRLFADGKSGEVMVAVIASRDDRPGKLYRLSTKKDIIAFENARRAIATKEESLTKIIGYRAVPDEPTPDGSGSGAERGFNVRNYSLMSWGDLFNSRQKLVMITFLEKLRQAYQKMLDENVDEQYAKAVTTYLGLTLDRMADKNSNLVRYNVVRETIEQVFGRQALPIVWHYAEVNPFTSVGWPNMQDWVKRVIEHCSVIDNRKIHISQSSATSLPYDNDFFDAVFTDPPYYDNIPYSYLSDFFYVWLKRSIGYLYPELFSTPLTPKQNEVVAYGHGSGGLEEGKQFFEKMLRNSFQEIARVLKPDGIVIIVYAHKSSHGWETLINSLLNAGLVATAAWPLHTEMKARLVAHGTASLSSSIYMVCRKLHREPLGLYVQVKKEMRDYLNDKLDLLWREGISGADFFISAIGSAIEVFGKYEKILDAKDAPIPVLKLLDDTREIVTNYAIEKVLQSDFSDQISTKTRFYILWRWAYGESKISFDDARKMAQSVGMDLVHEWNKGFIKKESANIRVLGPEDRDVEDLEKSQELIDILHLSLLLWKNKKNDILYKMLEENGLDKSDMFKRVGQAISESLPPESTEKRWLDGFLTGFRTGSSGKGTQTKLF